MTSTALPPAAKGVFAFAASPFLPDGALDLASAARLTEAGQAMGTPGRTIRTVRSEEPTLDATHATARAPAPGLRNAARTTVRAPAPRLRDAAELLPRIAQRNPVAKGFA